MITYHALFDGIYGRPAKPFVEAVDQQLGDQAHREHGGAIEDLEAQQRELTKLVLAVCGVLDERQQDLVAAAIGLQRA